MYIKNVLQQHPTNVYALVHHRDMIVSKLNIPPILRLHGQNISNPKLSKDEQLPGTIV